MGSHHSASGGRRLSPDDALTELHTYRLIIEAECERLDAQLPVGARSRRQTSAEMDLARRRIELQDELQLLDSLISSLSVALGAAPAINGHDRLSR